MPMLAFYHYGSFLIPAFCGYGCASPERNLPLPRPVVPCRPRNDRERGGGNLKAIIWTGILVAFIYTAVMVMPVLINEYEFQDSLQSIARFASVNRKNAEQVRQAVLEEAQKEDLPIQAEDIKVEGTAVTSTSTWTIR